MNAVRAARLPVSGAGLLACATIAIAGFLGWPAIVHLAREWVELPAYGHGPVLVLIAAALLWQRRDVLANSSSEGALWSLPVATASFLLLVAATHGAIHVFAQYALVGVLTAVGMALYGWRFPMVAALPLLLLLLAIPLPGAIETALTSDLKQLSTSLAGELLRLLRVPVFIEGNMVDLGVYQLQVADACAGLNYLFPLLSLSVLLAAYLHAPLWKRVCIVAVSVPITVAMNTLRISVTGLLVRHFGPDAADGFVHAFEGWLLFLAALLMLLPIASLVLRLGPHGTSLRRALQFGAGSAPAAHAAATVTDRRASAPKPAAAGASALLAVLALAGSTVLSTRPGYEPQRDDLSRFPLALNAWQGHHLPAPLNAIRDLQLSEFLLAEFRQPDASAPIELYVAYYDSQADGRTPHSPADCLPGGGWEILTFERSSVRLTDGTPVPINRAVMQVRHEHMLVYYFYRQGPRWLNSEYLAKWYLFQDSVVEGRKDGALVRLTVPITATVEDADRSLLAFLEAAWPTLQNHFGA